MLDFVGYANTLFPEGISMKRLSIGLVVIPLVAALLGSEPFAQRGRWGWPRSLRQVAARYGWSSGSR